MISKKLASMALFGAVGCMLTGCMPDMTLEEMKTWMDENVQRPAELDRLDQFVGNWTGEGEACFSGKDERKLKMTGSSSIRWGGDGWYLIEEFDGRMEIFGKHVGHTIWTYDEGANCYRTSWFGNDGAVGNGTVRYDKKNDQWNMTGKTKTAMGDMHGKGTMRVTDKDTMEWCWAEYDGLGITKMADMCGTMRRK